MRECNRVSACSAESQKIKKSQKEMKKWYDFYDRELERVLGDFVFFPQFARKIKIQVLIKFHCFYEKDVFSSRREWLKNDEKKQKKT